MDFLGIYTRSASTDVNESCAFLSKSDGGGGRERSRQRQALYPEMLGTDGRICPKAVSSKKKKLDIPRYEHAYNPKQT
jgi:hypothetical protein